jgi:hypothetical protein
MTYDRCQVMAKVHNAHMAMAELAKTFFLSDIGSDRNWGSV